MVKYFISFVEECIQNPLYENYIGGRIEVYESDSEYASNEIRFFTNDITKFNKFRDKWDMKNVTKKQLEEIKKDVAWEFCCWSGKQGD